MCSLIGVLIIVKFIRLMGKTTFKNEGNNTHYVLDRYPHILL